MKKHRRVRERKFPPALTGALTACAVSMGLLALAALLTQRGSLPEQALALAVGFVCAVSALSGALAAALRRDGGVKAALAAGGVYTALLLLGGLLLSGGGDGGFSAVPLVCAVAPTLLGALLGRGGGRAKRRR